MIDIESLILTISILSLSLSLSLSLNHLQGNNIGSEGARYISDSLRTNSTITSIDLEVHLSLSLDITSFSFDHLGLDID